MFTLEKTEVRQVYSALQWSSTASLRKQPRPLTKNYAWSTLRRAHSDDTASRLVLYMDDRFNTAQLKDSTPPTPEHPYIDDLAARAANPSQQTTCDLKLNSESSFASSIVLKE